MSQLTQLEQLLYHLDKASNIAFSLRNQKDLGVNMNKVFQRVDGYLNDILEHNDEVHIPTDNY